MKKIFLSTFFAPVAFMVCWLLFMSVIYFCYNDDMLRFTEEGELIENITHCGYVVLIAVLLLVAEDYRDKMRSWGCFLFLAMCCFLREQGIQHHLSRTDTTPFKSRFFLNPNNPLGEKIIFGLVLLVVAGAVVYLAVKYSKHLVRSFFEFNPVTWSTAVLCTVGVAAKIVDRFPSNYRKAHGEALPENVYVVFQLLEESSEMFLPYLAIAVLWQYHLLQRRTSAL